MGEGLALAVILAFSQKYNVTNDEQYNNAIKHASLAAFVQSGMKTTADKEVRRYEDFYKEQVSKETQMGLSYMFWAVKIVQDQKIVYSWSF